MQRKGNLHFDDRSKQVVFFFCRNFLQEIENMFSVFLLSYRNTRLGELKKAVETLVCQPVFPKHFSFSQTI